MWPLNSAQAFSDPDFFADVSTEGGGSGRYFTGAPQDPFSCEVCHRGGTAPTVTMNGLPERFTPGERYEVTLRFAGTEASHALQLEVARPDGGHAELQLTSRDNPTLAERCEGLADGALAAYAIEVDEDRRILGVQDCGASEIAFAFTAPAVNELYFAMGMVRSDSSGGPEGDGTLAMRQVLTRAQADESPGASGAGCQVLARGDSAGAGWLVLLLGAHRGLRRCYRRRLHTVKGSLEVRAHEGR